MKVSIDHVEEVKKIPYTFEESRARLIEYSLPPCHVLKPKENPGPPIFSSLCLLIHASDAQSLECAASEG